MLKWPAAIYLKKNPCSKCGSRPVFIKGSDKRILKCSNQCGVETVIGRNRLDTIENWNKKHKQWKQ